MTAKKSPPQLHNKLASYLSFLAKQPKGYVYSKTTIDEIAQKKIKLLATLYKKNNNCQACPLYLQGRTQIVFGVGNANAELMFVGEAPGKDEDAQGKPFVGRSGQLLTKIIEAMGLERDSVFITNVVKSRPPENRTPTTEERETCKEIFLLKEIAIIKPKIICTLGAPATQALLGDEIKISQVRGKFFNFQGCLVMPTYHPAYLLRNPIEKKTVWEDMQVIMEKLKELA